MATTDSADTDVPGDRPLFSRGEDGGQTQRLQEAFGRPLDEEERQLWDAMLPDRRELTIKRIAVLERWLGHPGEQTAAEAARDSDVKVSRFYEIVGAWRARKALTSLGTFAKRPGRTGPKLDGTVVNRIQAMLVPLVAASRDGKISTIVAAIQEKLGAEVKLPHVNTLRTMVERERRRVRGEKQAGLRPGLDAVACDYLREDGTHHVVFGVVDRTSRFVLGFSVGHVRDSMSAYARAARDALRRIASADATRLPWADTLERVDVIVGEDGAAWADVFRAHRRHPIANVFDPVDSDGRYGRYFKLVAGTALGKLKIWPVRTDGGGKVTQGGIVLPDAQALDAIEIEIARHNAQVLSEISVRGAPRPAPALIEMLEFLAVMGGEEA
jgi:hypothetical protein